MLSRVQDHVVYINKDGTIGSTLLDGFFIQLDSLINIGVLEIGNSWWNKITLNQVNDSFNDLSGGSFWPCWSEMILVAVSTKDTSTE